MSPPRVVDLYHKPNPEVVETLERLLEMARRGELTAFAYVADLTGNDGAIGFVPGASTTLLGGLSLLEARGVDQLLDR